MNANSNKDSIPGFLEKGYILLFALLPWSVERGFGDWNLMVPSEPLILLLGLGLALALVRRPSRFFIPARTPSRFLKPGRSLAIWIAWMGISAACSTMNTVSLKYWLVEAGHFWVFGVGMMLWPMLWRRVLPYFLFSMLGVVCYTIFHHSLYGFRADQAMLAPMPFFPDHTLYAAVLAILIFYGQIEWNGTDALARLLHKKGVKNGITVFLFVALLLSTCRAALLSSAFAAAVFAVFYFRKKYKYLAAGALLTGLLILLMAGSKVYNASSGDVSVLERLNRWDCAASMLAARPLTGFGPGTYQFQYLPFQQPEKMTRISVREPLAGRGPDTYGRGGGAHSEYWQAGAELGWPGLVLWLTLVCSSLWLGFRRAFLSPEKVSRGWALLTTLGLLTFFIHALANNFLHDARIAALVWGGVAYLLGINTKK